MKKLFFMAVAASVAFAACVKNEPVLQENQKAISFAAPVVGTATKATTEISNNFPEDVKFAVWAHYFDDAVDGGVYTEFSAGQVYMDDVTVGFDGEYDGWASVSYYYWPKNGSLTFSAYSPAGVDATLGASGICFDDYVVSTTAADQVDLLFSERAYDKTAIDDNEQENGTTSPDPTFTADLYRGVHLTFNHALSSVLFSVYVGDFPGHKIVLKKIELTNIYSKGDFNQGLTDANGKTTTANADLWTNEADEKTYTITVNQELEVGIPYWPCLDEITNTAPQASNGKRATDWLLLPQEIAEDAQMIVTYTLQSPDSEPLEQVIPVKLSDPSNQLNVDEWKWGHRYHYNIVINLDEIYFEPYVVDWDNGTGSDYYVYF